MRLLPLVALALGIVGWVLIGLTAINLGSGGMEEPTCRASCLQTYFFSALSAGGAGLIIGILGLFTSRFRIATYLAFVLLVPLCLLIGGVILIGNLA